MVVARMMKLTEIFLTLTMSKVIRLGFNYITKWELLSIERELFYVLCKIRDF